MEITTVETLQGFEGAYYVLNSDNKIELHLQGKESYSKLPENVKDDIKRAFVWGRQRGAWVSRAKDSGIPWRMQTYKIPFGGEQERKTFEESREHKIERAEHKADRYEQYAESRVRQAESLQSEFNRLRKDWSWLTQPYVNTSGGRAFANSKNKVMARYERGFESYQIAQSHREKSEHYKTMAASTELQNESYLVNRVKEGEKAVRAYEKFEALYIDKLEKIDEQSDEWKIWLKARVNYYDTAFEKLAFYLEALRELNNKKKEAGVLCVDDINTAVKGGVKKQVKEYLKQKYGVDLLVFSKAFGQGVRTHYYIKTEQPLPVEYHSGFASDNVAQVNLARLLKDIEDFNK